MPRKRSLFIWQHYLTDFAWRLRRFMAQQHMSQSDLARACWGEEAMDDGFYHARGRDRINEFVMGKALPNAEELATLAKALGVDESALVSTRGNPEGEGK